MRRIVAALFNGQTRPDSNLQPFEAECPSCGHTNPGQSKFCNICGARLQVICPHCSLPNPITASACVHCHTELRGPQPRMTELRGAQPTMTEPRVAQPKMHTRAESRHRPEAEEAAANAARSRTPSAPLSHAELPLAHDEQRLDATAWMHAHPGFVVTGVVLAALAVPALYLYREYSVLDVPHAIAPGKVISTPAPAPGIARESDDLRSSAVSKSPPATVPDATTVERSADMDASAAVKRDPVAPDQAASKPTAPTKRSQETTKMPDSCPEGVAALGLCASHTNQRRP